MPYRWFMRVFALVFFAAYGSLTARAYDAIVVFGDSYNDVGNIHIIAGKLGVDYPPAPYYDGRFSNGPIWIEHVASNWGLPMLPSSIPGGTDYAVGGAELLQPVTLDGVLTIPSVEDQVAYYLAVNGGKANPKALYVIEGGGNDIIGSTDLSASNAAKLGGNIASGLAGIVATLGAAGAKSSS
jgi:phospholipase/lecithinase/hemolysin